MVLDTSAIVAALAGEPDGPHYQTAMFASESLSIVSVVVLETRIVLHSRYGAEAVHAFDAMLASAQVTVVPFDAELAQIAFDAFRRYGKGQGHRAQLNIVDCTAYALAKSRQEPLLFKGRDFEATDIERAIPPA
ncbi:MAG: type II toxin-antitoxin system VapC family toxin [Rhizomicrobium sp.]